MRADTKNVAFRLLLALGDLSEGLQRAGIDPSARGLFLSTEHRGAYIRYSAGPSTHPRIVVEWNESSRHLRVLRCDDWPGFDALVSNTLAYVRAEARRCKLSDVVDRALTGACREPAPSRRTVVSAMVSSSAARTPVALRRA